MIGPIDRIFTRIGASDDLAGGRSTFMVEMTEAAVIVNSATERSLVLVDEIGRGTSTFDGLALAHAIAFHLLETSRSLTLFATHYFELTALASQSTAAVNLHLAAAEHAGGIVFLHQVRQGPASQSYGLQVARLAGLPANLLRHARTHAAVARAGCGRPAAPDGPVRVRARLPRSDAAAVRADREAGEPPTGAASAAPVQAIGDELRSLAVDELTPRLALERIYRWRALLDGDEPREAAVQVRRMTGPAGASTADGAGCWRHLLPDCAAGRRPARRSPLRPPASRGRHLAPRVTPARTTVPSGSASSATRPTRASRQVPCA